MDSHKRYLQQAAWTRDLRTYLFQKAGLAGAVRVLEVGCGTGAILRDLVPSECNAEHAQPFLYGLDIAAVALAQCRMHSPSARLARGDALALPYAEASFDITFCHFLLLWVKDPLAALREMKRVTNKGGSLLTFAEPDYRARLDRPQELVAVGELQNRSLQQQGADIGLGDRLADLFDRAGIHVRETGALAPWPAAAMTAEQHSGESESLRDDLARVASGDEVERMLEVEARAHEQGQRFFYVPTYFAWGQV